MSVGIKRLYIENYKLFTFKEIDFRDTLLSVFDGPNGYGKTSIFDAIELLVTGQISRVKDSDSINGTMAYETNFLAKDSQRDVLIKGEFGDDENGLIQVLAVKLPNSKFSGKQINPKNIFDIAELYYLPDYEICVEDWPTYSVSKVEMDSIRSKIFGKQNLEQFTLFHYIRQEDRLAYFKKNEKDRSIALQGLFGIEAESERHKNAIQCYKDLSAKVKEIEKKISEKQDRLLKKPEQADGETEYIPILGGELPWDERSIIFDNANSEELLFQYNRELNTLDKYILHGKSHPIFYALKRYDSIEDTKKKAVLSAWWQIKTSSIGSESIEQMYQTIVFLKKQRSLIEERKYEQIEYIKLCDSINLSEYGEILSKEAKLLSVLANNQKGIQKALTNILSAREKIHDEKINTNNGRQCPYCGHDWNNDNELETEYQLMTESLKSLLTDDSEEFTVQSEKLYKKLEELCVPKIEEVIVEFSNKDVVNSFAEFGKKATFIKAIDDCKEIAVMAYDALIANGNEMDSIEKLTLQIEKLRNSISDDYLRDNEENKFEHIRDKFKLDEAKLESLTHEKIETKRRYIAERFYTSFNLLQEEITKLTNMKNTLSGIRDEMQEYSKALGDAIEKYKKQIIDQIEIPFFVYSSRMLQSYQGGQGVLMENDGKTIRFKAPGSEHDVLYTMSSGQLSAVLLAFSLAMNKIYAIEGIKTVFIDDPIQCMDDINMISFVELLRREFGDCQIILSTHEEDFSNFIRYKFNKYGMETRAISLKDA